MSSVLVNHPTVVAAIVAVLRGGGIAKQDVKDGLADVQLRALESFQRRDPPADVGAMRALCVKIAHNYAINRWKKQSFRSQWDTGLCEEPDEHGPLAARHEGRDPVDERRQLEALADLFREGRMPEHGARILEVVSDGGSFREVGDELGITADTVKGRLKKMRRIFRARLAGIGLVAAVDPESRVLAALDEAA
jgi:DNA-directed RNA polymerase specialized sigma24 family protein